MTWQLVGGIAIAVLGSNALTAWLTAYFARGKMKADTEAVLLQSMHQSASAVITHNKELVAMLAAAQKSHGDSLEEITRLRVQFAQATALLEAGRAERSAIKTQLRVIEDQVRWMTGVVEKWETAGSDNGDRRPSRDPVVVKVD